MLIFTYLLTLNLFEKSFLNKFDLAMNKTRNGILRDRICIKYSYNSYNSKFFQCTTPL